MMNIQRLLLLTFVIFIFQFLHTKEIEELHPVFIKTVNNIPEGNLSGLTFCQGKLWAVSDKNDHYIYQLDTKKAEIEATPVLIPYFPSKKSFLNLSISSTQKNYYDFEGISCDQKGRLYLVSEEISQILLIDHHRTSWLNSPKNLIDIAHVHNLLKKNNAGLEGIAVHPDGNKIWLAAERENRGIIELNKEKNSINWLCLNQCILLSDGKYIKMPIEIGGKNNPNDFSDIIWHKGKLFTLERGLHQICRRNPQTAHQEKCWSFKNTVLAKQNLYPNYPYGMAEALWLDDSGAYIGLDNNLLVRNDGEIKPVLFYFNSPKNGWFSKN